MERIYYINFNLLSFVKYVRFWIEKSKKKKQEYDYNYEPHKFPFLRHGFKSFSIKLKKEIQ